jgi:hypothetical protein
MLPEDTRSRVVQVPCTEVRPQTRGLGLPTVWRRVVRQQTGLLPLPGAEDGDRGRVAVHKLRAVGEHTPQVLLELPFAEERSASG